MSRATQVNIDCGPKDRGGTNEGLAKSAVFVSMRYKVNNYIDYTKLFGENKQFLF